MTAQPARIDLADLGPGVAWAFEFDENGRGRLLEGDSSFDLTHGRRFVWVHLILANARTRDWIGAQDALSPEAREVFLSKDRHPSLHCGGEALWGTLHDVRHEDQAGMEATDLRFALWPQFLLTARHHAARSAMAVKDQAEKGAIFEDSAALFESLLVAAADSIGEAAQEIAGELDQIEDRVLSDALRDESAALLRLRRGISRQERLVQAAHSVLVQLEQHRAESVLQAYRDLASRVRQRVDAFRADLHLQAERARLLQEEMAAQLATATNRNLFALTVVTTVLLPPAFVTGYFGMNTKGLPFGDSDYGTVYATVLCLLAAGVVFLLIRRYRAVS
jgi:zinc transporter